MDYKKGMTIKSVVTGITKYGIFVSCDAGYSGLIHISEISDNFVRNINDYIEIGEVIMTNVIEVDNLNKQLKLTIKNIDYKGDGKPLTNGLDNGFSPLKQKLNEWIKEKID